jgi:ElaB/YqjD/DUF883 family membrane-anchored ribosome-binding protein
MNIDLDQIPQLIQDADKILISPEGEESLVKLLEIKKQVQAAIEEVEKKLEEEALKINPLFKSISSDRVKVYYRAYGSLYKVDETRVAELPK